MRLFTKVKPGGAVLLTLLLLLFANNLFANGIATLPVSQSGDEKNLPTGFTQKGLGHYANEPKLKFDNEGDYLLLQFDGVPDKLEYTIKLNGTGTFGTFTVEESSDGVNFTTIKEYTTASDFGSKKQKDEIFTLKSDTRFIKWTYNVRITSQNVALGNISVSAREGNVFAWSYNDASIEMTQETTSLPKLINTYDDKNVTYSSSDENVAMIDTDGTVVLMGEGSTTITAALEKENVSASYTLNVSKTTPTIQFENASYEVEKGGIVTVKATTSNPKGKITYTTDADENTCVLDQNTGELLAGDKPATINVTANVAADDYYTAASTTCTVIIKDPDAQITDVLTVADFKATGTEYTNTYDIVKNSGVVYAGKTNKNNGIGLRATNSDCGIIVTANEKGYVLRSISVEWSSTTNRTLNIYGKDHAYKRISELYSSDGNVPDQGTKLGTIDYGKSTSLEVTGDYPYIGIRSETNPLQLKSITLVWEKTSTPATGSFTIGADRVATYYTDKAFVMPQGVTGGIVTYDNKGTGNVTSINVDYRYTAGSTVPAKTALLLKGEAETYTYNVTESSESAPADNALHGADAVDADGNTYVNLGDGVNVAYYTLSHNKEGKNVGFYFVEEGGAKTKYVTPHAFLALPYTTVAAAPYLSLDGNGGTTNIKNNIASESKDEKIYTATGVYVGKNKAVLTKGLYIIGGKKLVIK